MTVTGWRTTLQWRQFREVATAPDRSGEDAQTEAQIEPPSRVAPRSDGGQFSLPPLTIAVRLVQSGTWVVRGRQSPGLLGHEQGHWDIAGLVAHEMDRALQALRAGSAQELGGLIATTIERLQGKVDRMQEAYDRDTNHGRNVAQQQVWVQRIQTCIANGNAALPDPR